MVWSMRMTCSRTSSRSCCSSPVAVRRIGKMNRQLPDSLGVRLVLEVHPDHRRPSFLHIRIGRMGTVHYMTIRAKGFGREWLEFDCDRLGHDGSLLSILLLLCVLVRGAQVSRLNGTAVFLLSSSAPLTESAPT